MAGAGRYHLEGKHFLNLEEVAHAYNMPYKELYNRLADNGCDLRRALGLDKKVPKNQTGTALSRQNGSRFGKNFEITVNNKTYKSLADACRTLNKTYIKVQKRLLRNWSIDEAFEIIERPKTPSIKLREEQWLVIEELGKKKCQSCGKFKELQHFSLRKDTVGGVENNCKVCRVAQTLTRRYGILPDEYKKMLKAQNNSCAICGTKEPGTRKASNESYAWNWCVDHDHQTGKVRKLLCLSCNIGLGKFDDDIKRLELAIQYLEKHKEDAEH